MEMQGNQFRPCEAVKGKTMSQECEHCKRLRESIEHLIKYKAKVSGLVISMIPDPYVMVRDLERALKEHKKRVSKES